MRLNGFDDMGMQWQMAFFGLPKLMKAHNGFACGIDDTLSGSKAFAASWESSFSVKSAKRLVRLNFNAAWLPDNITGLDMLEWLPIRAGATPVLLNRCRPRQILRIGEVSSRVAEFPTVF